MAIDQPHQRANGSHSAITQRLKLSTPGKASLQFEILIDPLCGQAGLNFGQNRCGMLLAQAGAPVFAAGRKWVSLNSTILDCWGSGILQARR